MQPLRNQKAIYKRRAGMQVQVVSQINFTGLMARSMNHLIGIAGERLKLEERNCSFHLSVAQGTTSDLLPALNLEAML